VAMRSPLCAIERKSERISRAVGADLWANHDYEGQ